MSPGTPGGPAGPRPDRSCVEARGLALGLRRAWRLRLGPAGLRPWRRAMAAQGLSLVASRTRFRTTRGGVLTPASAPAASDVHLVVIAADKALARLCLADELRNVQRGSARTWTALEETRASHERLGAAYGYPACCVAAFSDAHVEAVLDRGGAGDNGLALVRAARRSRGFHPWLAAIPGAFAGEAPTPLRHLPCRFDCAASIALAEALLRDLEAVDRRRHARLAAGVREPVWIDARGVAHRARAATQTPEGWRVTLADGTAQVASTPTPGGPPLPLLLPFTG